MGFLITDFTGQQQAQQQQQQQPEEQQQHYEEVNGHGINGVDEQNQGYSEVDQHEQNFEEPEQINGAPEISETDRVRHKRIRKKLQKYE